MYMTRRAVGKYAHAKSEIVDEIHMYSKWIFYFTSFIHCVESMSTFCKLESIAFAVAVTFANMWMGQRTMSLSLFNRTR